VEFEWDAAKAESNLRKHAISFEAATAVFDDAREITSDGKNVDGEVRFETIGRVGSVTLFVVFALRQREDGTVRRRIISARRASRLERAIYE
jgi:uncharacterized protein